MADTNSEILMVMRKTEQDSVNWTLDSLDNLTQTRRILFLNAHGINIAVENPGFRQALLSSDHLLRDGIGLEIGLKLLGLQPTENLNGTDLIPEILDRYRSKRIAVWGSSDAAIEKLRERLESENHPNIVSMHHGFDDDDFYIREYQTTRPDIVVLCMGMPRQELLASKLNLSGHGCLIICGGGWANFYSGHTKRAPLLIRKAKLEWIHRLMREPLRLSKRYTIGIVKYFYTIFKVSRKSHRANT